MKTPIENDVNLREELKILKRSIEIEAALEKVRTKTMNMQHSDELAEASFLLDSQVRELGIKTRGCAFNIYGENESTEWFSSEMGTMPKYKTPREHIFLSYIEAGLQGETLLIHEYAGEECAAHYDYLCSLPGMGEGLRQFKASGGSFPTRQIDHVAYFKYGYLLFITLEPVPEAHDIFKRFAKVFEQTYTRFLDLQKAEAQAREAEIELALEKVRARTMAMHDSADLRVVVSMVFEELTQLGFAMDGGITLVTFNDQSEEANTWIADHEQTYPVCFKIPYSSHTVVKDLWDAHIGAEDFFSKVYSKKEKNHWFKYAFEKTDLKFQPLERKEWILSQESLTQYVANAKDSMFVIHSHSNQTLTENEFGILKRFSKVFEQTYTRFLDLQKAEAQAREAQIEVALEKVRSASMAMHKSEELIQVVRILDKAISGLGIEGSSTQILTDFANPENGENVWVAVEGQDYLKKFHVPFIKHPILKKIFTAVQKGTEFYTETYLKTEKNKFFKILFENSDYRAIPKERQDFLYNSPGLVRVVVLSENSILIFQRFDLMEFSKEEEGIFKRFGKAFEQAYTRFLDLQKAEIQAREAQIEVAVERVRSRSMAMQHPDDLLQVNQELYQQLQKLNVKGFTGVSLYFFDEEGEVIVWDLSSPGNLGNPNNYTLKFSSKKYPILGEFLEYSRKAGDYYTIDYPLEKLRAVIEEFKDFNPAVAHAFEQAINNGNLQHQWNAFGKITGGALGIDLLQPPTDDTKAIVLKMAGAFNLAYKRFLDLQKAEEQAIIAKKNIEEIEKAYRELKATQAQLIQSEKMASLGELTAGVAHEIQNPLNFVNNFSEVTVELIEELEEEGNKNVEVRDNELEKELLTDIKQNLKKIHHHGNRASSIVKGMLEHSRTSSGKKELTDINALADEYLRLAYHGLRAKDSTFNAAFKTDLGDHLPLVEVIPQDIGRVLLNIINNAFHATSERSTLKEEGYKPTVSVSTKLTAENQLLISIKDNGPGIPVAIKDKIFQPFFTTKETGKGTGLGLSLAYDIVTKGHGGSLDVKSKEGEGCEFVVILNI